MQKDNSYTLNKIIIGAMRLPGRREAVGIIRRGIDAGFNYIDTAPLYCYKSEDENSESWVGEAVNHGDYRERVFISTKSAVTDGGLGLGEFQQHKGFGVRNAEEFNVIYNQSLRRMGLKRPDFYHLWICHTYEQFQEASREGSWIDAFKSLENSEGQSPHLGLTSHGDSETVIRMLKSGLFETVTIPLNIINTGRLKVVDFCRSRNIKVIAMNPLGGGLLACNEKLKELALRYLMSLDNVHVLIGFSKEEEVDYAAWIVKSQETSQPGEDEIKNEMKKYIHVDGPLCTACGYCQPCENFIDIGGSLSYYNLYKYMGLEDAKDHLQKVQWNPRYNLNNCTLCGKCEDRCPNQIPIRELIKDARRILYSAAD